MTIKTNREGSFFCCHSSISLFRTPLGPIVPLLIELSYFTILHQWMEFFPQVSNGKIDQCDFFLPLRPFTLERPSLSFKKSITHKSKSPDGTTWAFFFFFFFCSIAVRSSFLHPSEAVSYHNMLCHSIKDVSIRPFFRLKWQKSGWYGFILLRDSLPVCPLISTEASFCSK